MIEGYVHLKFLEILPDFSPYRLFPSTSHQQGTRAIAAPISWLALPTRLVVHHCTPNTWHKAYKPCLPPILFFFKITSLFLAFGALLFKLGPGISPVAWEEGKGPLSAFCLRPLHSGTYLLSSYLGQIDFLDDCDPQGSLCLNCYI